MRFHHWVVLADDPYTRGKVLCRCDCGVAKSVAKGALVEGKSRSCGCVRAPRKPYNPFLKRCKGHVQTAATREKLRLAHLGKKPSEEVRKKMCIAHSGRRNSGWIDGRTFCPKCGRRMSGSESKTCLECFKKLDYADRRGAASPVWKGGLTPIHTKLRTSPEYRSWRMDVFRRDGFTCSECGAKRAYLNAHHVKSFTQYPEGRYDIDNGITLCASCHKAVHANRKVG